MLTSILIGLAIILVSLSVHEAAHAWTADRLGDPTARLLGRITLNPVAHIDPIGTLLLPFLAAYSGLPIIGWAKPVPVNVNRLRNGRRDFMLVAAAGPLSNIAQAVIAALIVRIMLSSGAGGGIAGAILDEYVRTNLLLAFFNLVPVPPLDGGNVLAGLLPPQAAGLFIALRQYGFIVLYALMFTGALSAIVLPPTQFLYRILLP